MGLPVTIKVVRKMWQGQGQFLVLWICQSFFCLRKTSKIIIFSRKKCVFFMFTSKKRVLQKILICKRSAILHYQYAGSLFAWMQWVRLHPWFLRNFRLIKRICTHRPNSMRTLICNHTLKSITTPLAYMHIVVINTVSQIILYTYIKAKDIPWQTYGAKNFSKRKFFKFFHIQCPKYFFFLLVNTNNDNYIEVWQP